MAKRKRSIKAKPALKKPKNSIVQTADEEENPQIPGDSLETILEEEQPTSDGEDCELHIYESRLDTRGEAVVLRAGTKSQIAPVKRRSHRACLVLTRHYNNEGKLKFTEMTIQSRYIIEALRDVIRTHPEIHFDSSPMTIREPPKCLFHYKDELMRYAQVSDNIKLNSHMQLYLNYVEKIMYQEIKLLDSLHVHASSSQSLEHCHLWVIFKPGCLLYQKQAGVETLLRLRNIHESLNSKAVQKEIQYWTLTTEHIDYKGNVTGFVRGHTYIKKYDGSKPICELDIFPLSFHPENQRIRHDLQQRGRRFLSLYGVEHAYYNDIALVYDEKLSSKESQLQRKHVSKVKDRVMIDVEGFGMNIGTPELAFVSNREVHESGKDLASKFSEEEVMICHFRIPGYSLRLKEWFLFLVDSIAQIEYDDKAFDSLILEKRQKELVSSLLEPRENDKENEFDDLIQGKGKGLIFLLHGPPGVGKTYTAESIADHTRRPLLKINSSQLFGHGRKAEDVLPGLFSLAMRWNSIFLIDEADVFMQERARHHSEANQLVSTLLRVLEYFEGTMFLTTNRLENIDRAFKSRIHLAIAYPDLSVDARRSLWTASIVRSNAGQSPEWLTTAFLDFLTGKEANGREIKNIVRIGHALAQHARRGLISDDLIQGLDALEKFNAEVKK